MTGTGADDVGGAEEDDGTVAERPAEHAAEHAADRAADEAPRGRRRVDVVGLVAGVVFVAMAAAFVLADLDSLEEQVRFVWPTALLGIGLGMLLGTRRRR